MIELQLSLLSELERITLWKKKKQHLGCRQQDDVGDHPLHNVFFVQFFFPSTERGGTYRKIWHLLYHVTYVCPNSFGRGENRENSIFASLKL